MAQPSQAEPLALQQQLYPPPPAHFASLPEGAAPPPVIQGEYPLFGELHTTQDGLPPLHVRQLFDTRPDGSVDYRGQLLALHKELMANFLELLAVLVERPSGYARQVENVGLVLRNMQYLANQLRPHQARATLTAALEREAEDRRAAGAELRCAVTEAEAAIEDAKRLLREARDAAAAPWGQAQLKQEDGS